MTAWSEHQLIERIRLASKGSAKGLLTSIGDDCCEVSATGSFLISTDSLVDSVHFNRDFHSPHLLGRKSMAVNLSDVAAMGGRPRFILLSLCLPEDLEWDWISAWLDGALEILGEYNCLLIGGDTVKASELAFTVTVLGEPVGGGALYRTGAQAGDSIWVSGPLGSAGAGLELLSRNQQQNTATDLSPFSALLKEHLSPQPEITLGMELAKSGFVSSMQDISDGIATDLAHICKASGVSAHINSVSLPHRPELQAAADLLQMPMENLILRAGEDYRLLFTGKKGKGSKLSELLAEVAPEAKRIGDIHSGDGLYLHGNTETKEISFQGYEH